MLLRGFKFFHDRLALKLFIVTEVIGTLLYVPYYVWLLDFNISKILIAESANVPYGVVWSFALSRIIAWFVRKWESALQLEVPTKCT